MANTAARFTYFSAFYILRTYHLSMKRHPLLILSSFLLLLFFLSESCDETFELNAPYEDIWVVYGVLNPQDSIQYIRVSKVFQPESDAFLYAENNDESVPGLKVELEGNDWKYTAIQIDSVPKQEGSFFPYTTLYAIYTQGDSALEEGERYDLKISADSLPDFQLNAYTLIPEEPRITSPSILTRDNGEKCLQQVPFEDSVNISFFTQISGRKNTALEYEIRILMYYEEDSIPKRYRFGPTKLFNVSQSCSGGFNRLCYKLGNGVVFQGMKSRMLDTSSVYTYNRTEECAFGLDSLTRSVVVSVTAIDTFLSYYIIANDPRFLNLNTHRKEYSNIQGSDKAVGVFGAIATDSVPVALTGRARFDLGLNP